MKKCSVFLLSFFLLLIWASSVKAQLITIGTAGYDSDGSSMISADENYNLIWDNDDDLIWMDYTNQESSWAEQNEWASSLNESNVLVYNIDSAYIVDWGTSFWRLPDSHNLDGSGPTFQYHTNSEMGHLFYIELGLDINYPNGNTDEDLNDSEFDNLTASYYWSETDWDRHPGWGWYFDLSNGFQSVTTPPRFDILAHGLAVHSGNVSVTPVPMPPTLLLFTFGLIGLVGVKRKMTVTL